jgi:hypothetical protein
MSSRKRAEANDAPPVTFAEISRERLTKRVSEYRDFVNRRASGETLDHEQTEQLLDVMEALGLPEFAFERDAAATVSFRKTTAKWEAFVADEPKLRERGRELMGEIKTATERLNVLRTEAHRIEVVTGSKAAGYRTALNQMTNDHPHILLPIEDAVRLRSEALARRRTPVGVS